MKQLFFFLCFMLFALTAFTQFADTAQLNQFIRDTIRDRRPDKITSAQLQQALLGLSDVLGKYNFFNTNLNNTTSGPLTHNAAGQSITIDSLTNFELGFGDRNGDISGNLIIAPNYFNYVPTGGGEVYTDPNYFAYSSSSGENLYVSPSYFYYSPAYGGELYMDTGALNIEFANHGEFYVSTSSLNYMLSGGGELYIDNNSLNFNLSSGGNLHVDTSSIGLNFRSGGNIAMSPTDLNYNFQPGGNLDVGTSGIFYTLTNGGNFSVQADGLYFNPPGGSSFSFQASSGAYFNLASGTSFVAEDYGVYYNLSTGESYTLSNGMFLNNLDQFNVGLKSNHYLIFSDGQFSADGLNYLALQGDNNNLIFTTGFTRLSYKNLSLVMQDNIEMDGGSSYSMNGSGVMRIDTAGVYLGHKNITGDYTTDLSVATDSSITVYKSTLKKGDSTGQYLTTDSSGKLMLKTVAAVATAINGLSVSNDTVQLGGNMLSDATITINNSHLWFKTPFRPQEDTTRTGQVFFGDSAYIQPWLHTPPYNLDGQYNAAIVIAKTKENNNENVDFLSMSTADAPGKNGWRFFNYTNVSGLVCPRLETYSNAGATDFAFEHDILGKAVPGGVMYMLNFQDYDSANVASKFSPTTTDFFAIANNYNIGFYVDNHFDVGIGKKPTPGVRLDVSGSAHISDTLETPNIALKAMDTTNYKLAVVDASGNHFKMNWPSASASKAFSALTFVAGGNTTWDLNNSTNATLHVDNSGSGTTLVISNVTNGQEGNILITCDLGGPVNLPTGSKRAVAANWDPISTDSIADVTVIGKDVNGNPATGQWLCHFIYDGSEYIWAIKQVVNL